MGLEDGAGGWGCRMGLRLGGRVFEAVVPLTDDMTEDEQALLMGGRLQQRLELQAIRVRLHRLQLLAIAPLDALNLPGYG